MTLLPVLLAGGTGSRLWPLSREQYPKQFLALTDARSLLQNTALRTQMLPDVVPPLAICAESHRFIVAEQLRAVQMNNARVLLEPEGRNTGPATTCAALLAVELYGADTVLFVMAADHTIPDESAFAKASAIAVAADRESRSHRQLRHPAHAPGNRLRLHPRRCCRWTGRRCAA